MTETIERTAELSPALRKLVDERLDGIERVLRSAALPRGERVQVVEDVERQLLDMLSELPQPSTRAAATCCKHWRNSIRRKPT